MALLLGPGLGHVGSGMTRALDLMTDTDCKEDEVLKRMLKAPPKKHEPITPLGKRRREKKSGADRKADPAVV